MYIDVVPNRNSPPAILLRQSYRQDGKVKKRTLANLSAWPPHKIEALRRVLADQTMISAEEAFEVRRSLPHGHVQAVLGTLKKTGLEKLVAARRSRKRDLALAMITARVIAPRSKLATARGLNPDRADTSLGEILGLGEVTSAELYDALDWLGSRQGVIEDGLAARHLKEGAVVLYDVTSTYFEGEHCPLATYGYSRDKRGDRPQVIFGLLTDAAGCPLAVEVFEGRTGDPTTLASQVDKLQHRFGLKRVVVCGDRGMITSARIRQDLGPAGLDWITSLRGPQIRRLVEDDALQLSLFDQTDLAEITHPDYPGERLIACYNPRLAAERARKRTELLAVTEARLHKIAAATSRPRRPLQGSDEIGIRVGKVLAGSKVAKHFSYQITEDGFTYQRREELIAAEAALDGIYIVRTSVPADQLAAPQVVAAYKGLDQVERAFRTFKGIDLRVRPIYHRLPDRVKAHIFLCMLAYYTQWHMQQALRPLLFAEEDPHGAQAQRHSVVSPAQRSPATRRKTQTQRTDDGFPLHSFPTLLSDLATICLNHIQIADATLEKITTPTPLQQRAFQLLGVKPR